MSANINTMIHVGELPWHGLSKDMSDNPPKNAYEIAASADLNWTTNFIPMKTDLHESVPCYNAIYREDNMEVLGVVDKAKPKLVQNSDAFNSIDTLIGKELMVDTAASLGKGETVFGCFRISDNFKILDDDVAHYFVIVNDHLKADGKVTVLNTPVRVVCQNTLTEALSNNVCKIRIPISFEESINISLANKLIEGVGTSIVDLSKRAEDMATKHISAEYMNKLMDIIFPYQMVDGMPAINKANETINLTREMFIRDYMGADNLSNYRGTQYQIFNALTDFTQHSYKSVNKSYDLAYRMKRLPGFSTGPQTIVSKYLSIADKLAA